MELSLVGASAAVGGHHELVGQPAPAAATTLVAVPGAVAELLQLMLCGPGARSEAKACVWAAAAACYNFSAAYWIGVIFPVVDPALTAAGRFAAVMLLGSGIAKAVQMRLRWRLLFAPGTEGDAFTVERNDRLVSDLLLRAEVTPDAAAAISKRAKAHRVNLVPGSVILWIFFGVMAYGFHVEGVLELNSAAAIAIAVTLLLQPVGTCAVHCATVMDELAAIVVVDRVTAVTQRVQQSTPATADWDRLLTEIVDLQHVLVPLCAALEGPIKVTIVHQMLITSHILFTGFGPQPDARRPDYNAKWWHELYIADISICMGAALVPLTIWVLAQPAKITSACEALADAINDLTLTKEQGETTLRMPTREQEQHIEHLRGFVRGLNRGSGMGFMIQRKRISHSFVMTMTVRALSAMVFIFPIMLKEGNLEADDDALLDPNRTCCACPET
eukprot:COSAG06_NODE_501_length_14953_cov_25.827858_17_plen_445_part_00